MSTKTQKPPVSRIAMLEGNGNGHNGSAKAEGVTITVKAPNLRVVECKIVGDAPYMQHAFSEKARRQIEATQRAGSTARGKKQREARDFEQDYEQASHRSDDGWYGIPASAFRAALISACRLVGFPMTKAKLSIFCLADGLDARDRQGLVRIQGKPEMNISAVRLESGVVSLAARPLWTKWSALVRLRFDADQFTLNDVVNLLMRAGAQVGVGEGRPDSKNSAGLGYGTFTVEVA